jgi:hypothetical protein
MTPAADAAAVETGATVRVVFSQALDAATLTPANFRILTSATPIPLALSYDAGTRTARAAAPLVPGTDYTVEVTTGVRSATGVSLDATRQWSFATRDWAAVTVDAAGDVGWWTSVALESNGRRHVSYQDRDNLDLRYATCSVDCTTAGNWQAITLDAAGSAGYTTSIAVEAGGRVHLADFDLVGTNLEYFTCAADCATAVNWGSTVAAATGTLGD